MTEASSAPQGSEIRAGTKTAIPKPVAKPMTPERWVERANMFANRHFPAASVKASVLRQALTAVGGTCLDDVGNDVIQAAIRTAIANPPTPIDEGFEDEPNEPDESKPKPKKARAKNAKASDEPGAASL